MSRVLNALGFLCLAGAVAGPADARDRMRIVGSSTVYPFATAVAEEFGRNSQFKTPIIESTGSGGGIKLFCAGVGDAHPDIANASRRIKPSEVEQCAAKHGVPPTCDTQSTRRLCQLFSREEAALRLNTPSELDLREYND